MKSLALTLAAPLPGTCPVCGCYHDPDKPHHLESLYYKYGFFDAHGRNPTIEDACAHCKDKTIKPEQTEIIKKRHHSSADKPSEKPTEEDDGQLHF